MGTLLAVVLALRGPLGAMAARYVEEVMRTYTSPVVAIEEDKLRLGLRAIQQRERTLRFVAETPDERQELAQCRDAIQAFREALGS